MSSLSSADVTDFYNRLRTYMNTVGVDLEHGADAMRDDIVKRLRDEIDIDANEPIDPLLLEEAADEIERLRDIVEKVAMGSFLTDMMHDAIRDALKYVSAMPAEG